MYNKLIEGLNKQPNIQPTLTPADVPVTTSAPTEVTSVIDQILTEDEQTPNPIQQNPAPASRLFDVNDFVDDLAVKSEKRNQRAQYYSNNINSYDIASNCIRQVLFKILNYPVQSYRDVWLPVMMRANLGNAVHEFIQDNASVFTESEVALRIPSQRLSVRLDNLINNNVLVEIKSCTYTDYAKILRTQRPRDPDFYQVMLYRYLLHNHLEEARQQPKKKRGTLPKLDKYNIDTVQIIYAAHDLISSETKSVSEAVKHASEVKKVLNSKHNKFFYITALTLDFSVIDTAPYEEYIVEKLNTINHYLNTNTIPPMDNKFVKANGCFFCLYKDVCKTV